MAGGGMAGPIMPRRRREEKHQGSRMPSVATGSTVLSR